MMRKGVIRGRSVAAVVQTIRRLGWRARILAVLGGAGVLTIASIEVTGQPGFCNSCHIMKPYYESWHASSHAQVNCLDCHLQPGFTGYIKGKINGMAQAIDCVVGRVGTKPNATVQDASCLRSECHSTAELAAEVLDCNGVRFSHEKHMGEVVGGIKITCGTCHSHFEGNEHFSVNRNACFACHFLGAGSAQQAGASEVGAEGTAGSPSAGAAPRNGRLVRTACQSCHKVPDQVIRRGFVKIDHSEFVSYQASCEDSCHKRELRPANRVQETVCLNCHSFRMAADANSVELHAQHMNGHKVECFACHGAVPHGRTRMDSVSAMMDCQSCHSDTHQVQRTLYSTQHPMQPHGEDRVLSPMFLTHVECTDCHTERTAKTSGTLDSFGTVARAAPSACDRCHEAGTGHKYVPFWQEKIKTLYGQVEKRVAAAEALATDQTNPVWAQKLTQRAAQARAILDSIRHDGSWGVHNFKYTEALLLEANKIVDLTQGVSNED